MPDFGGNTTALATAAVSVLTAIGAGIAWVMRRHDSKKDPVPKEAAAVALSNEAVGIMRGVANDLKGDIANLRGEVAAMKESQAELGREIQRLKLTLGTAATFIERLLRWAKSDSRPPIPALPSDLFDLIDPSLHD